MFHRIVTVCITAGILATLQAPAEAASVSDANDAPNEADIRSASVVQLTEKKLEVRLVFWGRTPMWLLRRHAARIEMSYEVRRTLMKIGFRFCRTDVDSCALPGASQHRLAASAMEPNTRSFTYLAVVRFSMDRFIPPIRSFRAARTARLPLVTRSWSRAEG
jgi:hypothetical protein